MVAEATPSTRRVHIAAANSIVVVHCNGCHGGAPTDASKTASWAPQVPSASCTKIMDTASATLCEHLKAAKLSDQYCGLLTCARVLVQNNGCGAPVPVDLFENLLCQLGRTDIDDLCVSMVVGLCVEFVAAASKRHRVDLDAICGAIAQVLEPIKGSLKPTEGAVNVAIRVLPLLDDQCGWALLNLIGAKALVTKNLPALASALVVILKKHCTVLSKKISDLVLDDSNSGQESAPKRQKVDHTIGCFGCLFSSSSGPDGWFDVVKLLYDDQTLAPMACHVLLAQLAPNDMSDATARARDVLLGRLASIMEEAPTLDLALLCAYYGVDVRRSLEGYLNSQAAQAEMSSVPLRATCPTFAVLDLTSNPLRLSETSIQAVFTSSDPEKLIVLAYWMRLRAPSETTGAISDVARTWLNDGAPAVMHMAYLVAIAQSGTALKEVEDLLVAQTYNANVDVVALALVGLQCLCLAASSQQLVAATALAAMNCITRSTTPTVVEAAVACLLDAWRHVESFDDPLRSVWEVLMLLDEMRAFVCVFVGLQVSSLLRQFGPRLVEALGPNPADKFLVSLIGTNKYTIGIMVSLSHHCHLARDTDRAVFFAIFGHLMRVGIDADEGVADSLRKMLATHHTSWLELCRAFPGDVAKALPATASLATQVNGFVAAVFRDLTSLYLLELAPFFITSPDFTDVGSIATAIKDNATDTTTIARLICRLSALASLGATVNSGNLESVTSVIEEIRREEARSMGNHVQPVIAPASVLWEVLVLHCDMQRQGTINVTDFDLKDSAFLAAMATTIKHESSRRWGRVRLHRCVALLIRDGYKADVPFQLVQIINDIILAAFQDDSSIHVRDAIYNMWFSHGANDAVWPNATVALTQLAKMLKETGPIAPRFAKYVSWQQTLTSVGPETTWTCLDLVAVLFDGDVSALDGVPTDVVLGHVSILLRHDDSLVREIGLRHLLRRLDALYTPISDELIDALADATIAEPAIHELMSQWVAGPQKVESNSSCGRFWLECVLAKWFQRARTAQQDDATLKNLTACVTRARELLPPVLWLSVFYTITLHLGCTAVAEEVQAITTMLLVKLPRQAIWHVVGRRHLPAVQQAIAAAKEQLVAKKDFVDTWNAIISIAKMLKNAAISPCFDNLDTKINCKILVPTTSQLVDLSGPNPVYIKRIRVGPSMVKGSPKPRIAELVGSDDKTYRFLLKKDAIRKDEFVMRSATLVNHFLAANTPTIDIRLQTYAVVPLADNIALIEWVPNTITLFSAADAEARAAMRACMLVYKKKLDTLAGGDIISGTTFTELMSKEPENVCELYKEFASNKCFKKQLVKWFTTTFGVDVRHDRARIAFLRSAAVSSIFGYFLDVGDRHNSNILLDTTSGTCVHIDFECIFGLARRLRVPECVPFRLTRNIYDALSANNDLDAFRTTCEAVLRVLRDHRAVLRCHVDMFVHNDASLAPNAVAILQALDKRLAGATMAENADETKNFEDIARDVKSQVGSLVDDATSTKNLMRMYLGWYAPF